MTPTSHWTTRKGTYSIQWQPHMVKCKDGLVPWSDRHHGQTDIVIMCAFELDSKNHLLENTRKYLEVVQGSGTKC